MIKERHNRPMDMANQFLSLSMFIMLLSFFIILNSLSSYEDVKSRPVLNSISMTFSNETPEQVLAPNVVESIQESNNEGDTLEQLKRLFSAHITGAKASTNRLGTMMHIKMPLKQFENSLLAPVRKNVINPRLGEPGTFMPTLLSLMQTRETDIPYRMDIVLTMPQNPAIAIADDAENTRNTMRKISSLTKRLEDSGLEKKLISGGIGRGESDMVDIYFTRYVPVNPIKGQGDDQ